MSVPVTRRALLRAGLGAAGALALGACNRQSSTASSCPDTPIQILPPSELAVVERPTLRLAGTDYGLPSPFLFLPPAYSHMSLIYDSLLLHDSTGALVPWLARRQEASPDGRTYTFELREGVHWQDGQPFTADDVVFSFEFFQDQANKGSVAPWVIFRPSNVQTVTKLHDLAVSIQLDKPVVTFLDNVAARFSIVPRHIWSKVPFANEIRSIGSLVGTGPYRLLDYSGAEGSYLFEANDNHFLGTPFVRRIEMVPVGDQLTALAADEIDAVSLQVAPTNKKALDRFRRDPCYGILEGPADFVTTLNWNIGRGGALADVRFRRAVAHAIDRDELVRRLLGGAGHPGNPGFLPPGHAMRVDVEQYPYDPATANQILDAAGYRRGEDGLRRDAEGHPLSFSLGHLADLAQTARLVVDALGAIGVEANPREIGLLATDSTDLALIVHAGGIGDPDFMRVMFSSRVERKQFFAAMGYVNGELDVLADQQQVLRDDAERAQKIARMQQIVATDLPTLQLYYPTPFFLFRRSTFDQWTYSAKGGILNKQQLISGTGTGGTEIRRTTGGVGTEVADRPNPAQAWIADLPEGFPVPQGAVHRSTQETVGAGKQVSFFIDQSPQEVREFYSRELPAQGWSTPVVAGDNTALVGYRGSTQVSVTIAGETGRTLVMLTYR